MTSIVEAVQAHSTNAKPAIIEEKRTTTYRELIELAGRATGGLKRALNAYDDATCLVVSHSGLKESLALTLAGWSLGHRVALVPPYLKARETREVLARCGPVVTVSDTADDEPRILRLKTLLEGPADSLGVDVQHARLLGFTSGTTGHPMCVDRAVDRLGADIKQLAVTTGLGASDRVTAMTTALSTTSVLPALWVGATLVSVPLRSASQFWSTLAEREITVISGTPYAYELAVRRRPGHDEVSRVRLALSTSARLRPSTARKMMEVCDAPVRNIMCSSESGHIAYNDADEADVLATSVGRPLPGVEVEIRDEDGAIVAPGRAGRICVRSPFTATGYLGDPRATEKVFREDWVVSTDIGFLDKRGYLRLSGRNDHRIHFGAAKLDPQELEDALLRHPAVLDVLVVGEEHDRLGQVPVARVVGNGSATAGELLTHCRAELSPTKVPQRIDFVSEVQRDFKGQPVRPKFVQFEPDNA